MIPKYTDSRYMEQSVNNVLMVKSFVERIKPVWQLMTAVESDELARIREVLCQPSMTRHILTMSKVVQPPEL